MYLVGTRLYRHIYRHDVATDVLSVGRPTCPLSRFANKWGQMADDQNEKPQVVRFPEPGVEPAREAEERRVAEIAREIEELGRALEGRDRLAKFDTAERAEISPGQAGQSAGGAEDCSTPEPKPLPTVADMSCAPNEAFPQVEKFATIPASPQERKLVAEGGPPTRRRKWGPSLAAVIIVLSLVSGGVLMLMGPPIESAQDAYRSAVAEIQRLTARASAETEAAARKAAEEKALAEEAERKAVEENLAAVAAARRHEEEARQATEEKATAEAARQLAEAEARAAAQEAAKRQAAEEKAKAEAAARQLAEAEARAAAQEAAKRQAAEEKAKAEAAARQLAEAEARAAAQEAAKRQAAEEKAKAAAARQLAEAEARAAAQEAAKRQAAEEKAKAEAAARQLAEAEARAAAQEAAKRQAAEEKAKAEAAARQLAEAEARAAAQEAAKRQAAEEKAKAEIVEVQTRLEALGMKPGRLDGILGSRTIGAIKRYEEANGLPQTGNIDREILGRLRQEKPISQAESVSRKAATPSAAAGADQMYSDALKKLQDGDYPGAERGFKAFLQGNPKHQLAGNAQYWLGETYYARRDYQNAMTAFAEGYKVYKASPKGPDNLLKLGVTLAVLGRKPDACAVFAKFNQDYPRATDLQKRRVEQERQKNGCG